MLFSDLGGGTEIRGLDVAGFVTRRLRELDRVVGAVLGTAGGRINSHVRSSMLPGITQYVGDILVYQRHRERIHDRVREVVAGVHPDLGRGREHPVDVVAHSLGGVIAVDMATADDPLWVRSLVTFGSQSPFFHVCDPRGGRFTPFNGSALVPLPASLRRWTNLWEPLDVLAFIAARVFVLHDGSAPDDRAVPHLVSSGLWSHSAYWTLRNVADAIARALRPTE
jgi:triacylglycerol esterase/lipase EstA (alpha/beta hydrolase family)